jgi:hypothetical protein
MLRCFNCVQPRMCSPHARALFKRFLIGMVIACAEIVVVGAVIMILHSFIPAPQPAEMRSLYEDCAPTIARCRELEPDLAKTCIEIETFRQNIPSNHPLCQPARRAARINEGGAILEKTNGRYISSVLEDELNAAKDIKGRIDDERSTMTDEKTLRELSQKIHRYRDALESLDKRQIAFVRSACEDPELREKIAHSSIPTYDDRFGLLSHP